MEGLDKHLTDEPNLFELPDAIALSKLTCNKCRASEFHNECSLGYWCESYTPKEPCPKPLTIRQLIDAPKSCH